jgi:hypothetical protein
LQHAQLIGKLARLLEELQAHENDPEHAARLRVEIAVTREALGSDESRPWTERSTSTASPQAPQDTRPT